MVETDEGIEADGVAGDGEVLGEDAVAEGEEGVDGVAGRAAVAALEVELEGVTFGGFALDHAGELGEVETCAVALDAEEFF